MGFCSPRTLFLLITLRVTAPLLANISLCAQNAGDTIFGVVQAQTSGCSNTVPNSCSDV